MWRKTSPRPCKSPGRKHKKTSEKMKKLWADPEWRAARVAARLIRVKTVDTRRIGVPDGMRKPEAMALWAISRERAKETMTELKKAGVLDDADEKAEEALQAALEVMRSPMGQRETLAAARLVLDFTKAKPASKSELTINRAEEWLAQVTRDNEQAPNATNDGDAEASA